MSSGQKVALSFLAALICFAGFVFFAQTNLMSTIETKFYAQSKIAQRQEQLDKLSNSCNNYISNILTKIETDSSSYLNSPAVKSYANQNPSEKDEVTRRNLTSALFDTIEGLDGIRLIEGNGRNVHFSTYDTDVLKVDGLVKQYKNYPDLQEELGELKSEMILTDSNNPKHKIIFDSKQNRIIVSFPFYITEQTTFGSLVCYFNIYDFEQILVNSNLLPLGESFDLLTDDDGTGYGFACGIPGDGKADFTKAIINSWKIASGKADGKNKGPENLISQSNGTNWVLLNSSNNAYFNVGWVFKANLFELPKELIYIIYVSVFVTLLLIFLLIFSLKKDYLIKVKQRIKKVQLGIINEYLENKQQIEWDQIARQLEYRKEELSLEIKKSVGGKNKKYEKIIDVYLEQSWSEIINIINSQNNNQKSGLSGASIEEIRRVMEEVLQTAKLNVSVAPGAKTVVQNVEEVEEIEDAEEIEEVEAVDEVDEIEEIEEIDEIDEIEDAEEIEEADGNEEAEEIQDADEIDEVEAVEEIEDVDGIEEVEDVEDADGIEESEEVEEIEEIDEAETVEEIDEIEDAEEIEEIEAVEENDESDEIKEVDEIDDVDEIEEIEEAEEVEEVEEVEDADGIEESEEVEEIEEIDEAETVEEIDEIEDAEEIEDADGNEEAEKIEEADEVDEIEEAEEVLEERDVIEPVEETKEIDEAEPVEETVQEVSGEDEPVEIVDDASEEIEVIEENEADSVESLDEVEELEDIEIEKTDETVDVDISEEFGDLSEVGDLEELEDDGISLENSAITQSEPEYHYEESNRTFVSASSDDFASCDTIFAEDLCIGSHYTPDKKNISKDFNFVVYIPDFTPDHDFDMELAAADELLPEEGKFFSMTGFAENELPVSELEEIEENPAIVEKKGVYSISENIECSHLELNPEFKELVDSVLFR